MNARLGFALLLSSVVINFAWAPAIEAQQGPASFGDEPNRDLVVPSFADPDLGRLLTTLDERLAGASTVPDRADGIKAILWDFSRRLQAGRLSTEQEALVLGRLDDASRSYPEAASLVDQTQHVVRTLTIGKVAPDIVGTDLDGQTLRLSDYRGKVVALIFSGEWCGICRSEYPYERFLLEQYKAWPFAILAVNSDTDPETAKQAYTARGLGFRSWFDGDGRGGPRGPIASAWDVNGWPTAYLIDARGVIRFVNLRQEDLLKGVKQLLVEQVQLASRKDQR